MPLHRAARFLRRVVIIAVAAAAVLGALVAVQLLFNPFGSQLSQAREWMKQGDSLAKRQLMQGLSFGMIALAILVGLIPLVMKGVNRKQYLVATQRAIIASVILFGTQALFGWAEKLGDFYLILIMAGVVVVAFVLIETLSLLMDEDKEVAFRTDMLACISSSLIAGIILKLAVLLASRL
jgi:hypothetical protein